MPKKLDPDANAAIKLLGLFGLLLFSGKRYSLSELSRRFSCSKQTVLRMLAQLDQAYAIPVKVQSRKNGRQHEYWAEAPRRPLNVSLSAESLSNLLICRDLVCHLLPKELQDEAGLTVRHATALLTDFDQRGGVSDGLAESLPKGRIDYSRHQAAVKIILNAMRKRKVCSVVYHAVSRHAMKEYRVGPLRFAGYRDALYLKCQLMPKPGQEPYKEPMVLAVHRIESVTMTDETFKPPADDHESTPDVFGFIVKKPFPVRIRFSPEVAEYVSERTWSADQKIARLADGGVELKLTAGNELELLAWVLSFGAHAELLEPADTRNRLKETLARMTVSYDAPVTAKD